MEGKQEKKKKMGIKIVAGAGGGLAGIILLGGALATAALVSTFVIKRKQHSNSNSTPNQKTNQIDHLLNKSKLKDDHELGSEGLSFLVPDSSSPLNHHPSNGTVDTQNKLGSTQILILDETPKNEINGGKDKEIILSDFPKKTGNNPLCDESCISTEEFSFPVFDNSSGKVNKKNESSDEVEAKKVDEEVKAAHSNKVAVDDNRGIPSNIEEKDEGLCDGIGEIIVGKIEELVEAAQTDQLGIDENPHEPGEECDGERVVEKCEELVDGVHATNGIQLNEEQEATIDGDDEIILSDSSLTERHEFEKTYDLNKPEFLLPVIDGSSLSKPGNDDSGEVPLVIESMQVMKGDETIKAVEGDQITVEDRPQVQLIEPEEKEEPYEVDREITNGKCEEADQIAVEDDNQQMQLSEYQDTPINGDQEKFISDKLSPESNSCLVYGVKVQEFSLPPLDGPLLSESGNLNEDNSAEAALHVEVIKPMEEDETAEEVLYDQIIVENSPPMQSSEKGQIENCNDGSENVVAKGEEAVEIVHEAIVEAFNNPKTQVSEEEDEDDDDDHVGSRTVDEEAVVSAHVDIVEVDKNPQTQLSEAVEEDDDDNNGGSENGKEAVEMVHRDIFEVENTLQTQSSEEDDEEESDDEEDEEESDDEEDDVGKVEESSETTGDSSLESNAEAIWPAEPVQELSLKLKELQANDQNLEETNEEDMTVNTEHNCRKGYVQSNGHNIKEGEGKFKFVSASTQKFMTEIAALKQQINLFNLKFWILSLLVPLLLLLLLIFWLHFAEIGFLQVSS